MSTISLHRRKTKEKSEKLPQAKQKTNPISILDLADPPVNIATPGQIEDYYCTNFPNFLKDEKVASFVYNLLTRTPNLGFEDHPTRVEERKKYADEFHTLSVKLKQATAKYERNTESACEEENVDSYEIELSAENDRKKLQKIVKNCSQFQERKRR